MRVTLENLRRLDLGGASARIQDFIRSIVSEAGAEGVVVGISGGVDSAATLALSVKALGAARVRGLIMPDPRTTPEEDVRDAERLARLLGVKYDVVGIEGVVDAFTRAVPIDLGKVSLGNVRARSRMVILYSYANELNMLVAGTGDRSEILIGYFTKYGDGGVDFLPIGDLYKTQVRWLAESLGVPREIAYKPSSPRLWPGQTAETELGVSYETIDPLLHAIFDLGMEPEEAGRATGVGADVVRLVMERHRASEHKRRMPPTPGIVQPR